MKPVDAAEWVEKPFYRIVNHVYGKWPRPLPSRQRLAFCRIIAHRGEHDNLKTWENTLPAFEKARNGGIWGIEFDIRWTSDLNPVVFHDKTCRRLFRSDIEISQVSLAELKERFPLIPSLEEVIRRYGRQIHLMVELKQEFYPAPDYQGRVLKALFSALRPEKDFHFLSLAPEMFRVADFLPTAAFLPITRINVRRASALAIRNNYGGVAGHYLFLTNALMIKHRKRKQGIGTGFIDSRNALFRELNRGVDWIFSNQAVAMQRLCNALARRSAKRLA